MLNNAFPICEVLNGIQPPFTGEAIFDCLSDVVFFIKNQAGEYVVVNSTLVDRCRAGSKNAIVGRTPAEVLSAPYGERHEAQDRLLLESGKPLLGQLELHFFATGALGWCMTHKLPLRNADGDVSGLVGISQDLRVPNASLVEFEQVSAALQYAQNNLADSPSLKHLAAIANMSAYQLDRRMKLVFGLTTGQWLLKQRIDLARQRLRDTEQAIASIALDVGYGDQSAFTRQFRRTTGISPSEYRSSG